MKKLFPRFAKDESGVTAIEYGLIAALIAVAIILGATALGNSLNAAFSAISGSVDQAIIDSGAGTGGTP